MKLENVEADMYDEELITQMICVILLHQKKNISDGGRFEEVILTTISSVVGEMFDGMLDNSFTTPKRHAFSSDFVTVRVSN